MKLLFHISPIFRIVKSFVEVDLVMGGTDLLGEAIEPPIVASRIAYWFANPASCRSLLFSLFCWWQTWPEIREVALSVRIYIYGSAGKIYKGTDIDVEGSAQSFAYSNIKKKQSMHQNVKQISPASANFINFSKN